MRALPILLLLACAHATQLVPAPSAPRDPTFPEAAAGAVAGVEVSVGGKRWSDQPADLESLVAPLYVRVRNGSSVPVRIRYRDFTLASQSGLQTPATCSSGSAAGFLYFNHLREKGPVVFTAEIVVADTRQPLGTVRIPMVLQ